jgi:hypothetical protein
LAAKESAPFITGDSRLYQAVREKLPWVLWLGDYGKEGKWPKSE